ncbi:MAG: hypothetical protein AB7P40_05255 [Chloroflexota bacterium]
MQDDTQRHDAAAPAPQGAPQQPPPPAPAPAATPPYTESTVSPRGLEGLRSDPAAQPRGLGSLGLGAEREPLPFHTDLDSPLPFGYDHDPQEPMYLPLALSVGAGFKFGCGFMLAVGVSLFGLFLAASVIFFVAALAGLPVPGAVP